MIIVFRYQLSNVGLPNFREIFERGKLNNYNVIDSEIIKNRLIKPTSEIDNKVKYHIDNGLLISDAYLIDSLIQNWDSKKQNILVDFPKNIKQLNVLKYHLELLNDTIEKIIYYKIKDFDEIYDIAQTNYGKYYNSDMRESTINSMKRQMSTAEEMIKKLNSITVIELDFLNEDTKQLK